MPYKYDHRKFAHLPGPGDCDPPEPDDEYGYGETYTTDEDPDWVDSYGPDEYENDTDGEYTP